MGSILRNVSCFSLALVFTICSLVPAARAQTAGALTGVYNGKYTCGQGATNLKLSVAISPIGDVSALFTFYLPAEAPKEGYTYSLHGQFDPQIGKVTLTPVRWETEHAANLGMVGMEGALSGDRLSGRITGGRCTTFDLTRDKAESANIAAVIIAQKNGGKPITPSSWTAQLAAAQARTQPSAPVAPAAAPAPSAQVQPPAAAAPAPPVSRRGAQGTQVASAQGPAPPAAPQAPTKTSAKPPAATPQVGTKPPDPANPVLQWELADSIDPATGGYSSQPLAHTWIDAPFDTINARVNCNQNGMSVLFKTDTSDFVKGSAVFVWYESKYNELVTDVRVEADGVSHAAVGFPNEERGKGNWPPNEMGIFFYKPDLAIQQTFATERTIRTGPGLQEVGALFESMIRKAAEADASEAAATSAGPLTELLNARSIRVDLSVGDWEKNTPRGPRGEPPIRPWNRKPYLELNPQHPVLHKFVSECATKLGIGPPPAKAATPPPPPSPKAPPNAPPAAQPISR